MYVYVCVRICIYVSVYTCICMYCMDIHKYKCIYRTTSFYIQCVVVKPKGSIVRLPVGNNKTINRYIYVDARVAIEVKVIVVKSNASHDLVCQKKASKFVYNKICVVQGRKYYYSVLNYCKSKIFTKKVVIV
jgi:hypothetical protein